MKKLKDLPMLMAALLLMPFVSCKDDDDEPSVEPPVEPDKPVVEIKHSPLEPFVDWGADVPWVKANESRTLRRDTTVVLYGKTAVRTLIYDGRDEDLAYFYYYHFQKAELYQSEMLCPVNPETQEALNKIFREQYKFWRHSDVYNEDIYLTPDSSVSVRNEIWEDQSSGAEYFRVVYDKMSPEEIKKYYE